MEPENLNNDQDMMSRSNNENPKKNTLAIIAVSLFILLVGGMFLFAFLSNKDGDMKDDMNDSEMNGEDMDSEVMRIDGKHFYIDGVHTVVGEIPMPTPCDLLTVNSMVAESYPEQITLDFSTVNESETCAQVITPQRFKVSAEASPEATFGARFNGEFAELNLIEAKEGETPEDFELYIKG